MSCCMMMNIVVRSDLKSNPVHKENSRKSSTFILSCVKEIDLVLVVGFISQLRNFPYQGNWVILLIFVHTCSGENYDFPKISFILFSIFARFVYYSCKRWFCNNISRIKVGCICSRLWLCPMMFWLATDWPIIMSMLPRQQSKSNRKSRP